MEKGETENLLLCETSPPEKLFSGFEWRMSEPRTRSALSRLGYASSRAVASAGAHGGEGALGPSCRTPQGDDQTREFHTLVGSVENPVRGEFTFEV